MCAYGQNKFSKKSSLMEKYEGEYFDHFLAMYTVNFQDGKDKVKLDAASFKQMLEMYKQIEGEEAYSALIKEVKEVKANNDWAYFSNLEHNDFATPEEVKGIGEFIVSSQQ
jgi:hypothetical protein